MGLKKEFTEREVKRMRNLISGKTQEKTVVGIGYQKKKEYYNEGDVWEENGKTWTIKNGIKQRDSELSNLKKELLTPVFCPNCEKVMNKRNDKTFFKTHKMCFDCVVEFEHNLRKEGKWEDYQKKIKNNELDRMIEDFKSFIEEKRNEKSNSHVSQDGDVERWVGKIDQDRVDDYIKETVDFLENLKQ